MMRPPAFARLRSEVQTFLAWWLAELATLLPACLRPGTTQAVTVEIKGDSVRIGHTGRDGRQAVSEAGMAHPEQVGHLIQAVSTGDHPAILRLGPGQALRRTITLPMAAEGDLHDAVAFQIDRYTPFHARDVHFGVAVARRDVEDQSLAVDLAVAPRAVVATLTGQLRDLGIETGRLSVAGPDGRPDIFIGQEATASHTGTRSPAAVLPVALAILLAMADIVIPLVRGQMELEALRTEMGQAKAEAVSTAALRHNTDQELHRLRFAAERRHTLPTMELVLSELTRLVPDGTWATHLVIDGGNVQFSGYSNSANALVTVLEQSGAFTRASFRSPVTQDLATGREQFHLSAELRGRRP